MNPPKSYKSYLFLYCQKSLRAGLPFALAALFWMMGPVSYAGSILVTTTADSGPGSLREAVATANAGDTIRFAPLLVNQIITLSSGEISVGKNLVILGLGHNLLTVDGNYNSRVFHISPNTKVQISGLTISGGAIDDATDPTAAGGGILNEGHLTLHSCKLYNNQVSGDSWGFGGGIANTDTLYMRHTTVQMNYINVASGALAEGNGVYNEGFLEVRFCEISDNMPTGTGDVYGGGLSNSGTSAELHVFNSSFVYNSAYSGGGIHNTTGAKAYLVNTTLSSNTATLDGGGIENYGYLDLRHATIAQNSNSGLALYAGSTLQAYYSIFVGNSSYNVSGGGLASTTTSYTLSSDNSLALSGVGDLIDTSLGLQALSDMGKSGWGHLPIAGTSAVDYIDSGIALSTDQRGLKRPAGLDADAGATELGGPPVEPNQSPREMVFFEIGGHAVKLTFLHPSEVPDGYVVLRRLENVTPTPPADNSYYTVGNWFNGQKIVAMGSDVNYLYDETLGPDTTYIYEVFAFNKSGTGIDYKQTDPLSKAVTTEVFPAITDVSPTFGPVGTEIRIGGQGFAANPFENVVFFGTIKGTITGGAGSNELKVTVPPSAPSFSPITVLNWGSQLSANSLNNAPLFFTRTFPDALIVPESYHQVAWSTANPAQLMATGDLNADNLPDAVLVDNINSSMMIYYRKEDNIGFEWINSYTLPFANPTDLQLADIDRDGSMDIALAYGTSPGQVSIYFKNTDNSYQTLDYTSTLNELQKIEVADFNHDGKPDFAVLGKENTLGTSNIEVIHQEAAYRSFDETPEIITTMDYALDMAAGDFDADGLVDILVCLDKSFEGIQIYNKNDNNINYELFKNGPMFLTAINGEAFPENPLVTELNGDGLTDLIVLNNGSSVVSVLHGVGADMGQLSLVNSYDVPTGASSISLGDINGDGRLDILIGNNANAEIAYMLGNATGFESALTLAAGHAPNHIALADFNSDGREDVMYLNTLDTTLVLLEYFGPNMEVVSHSPANNAVNVLQDQNIEVTFDDAIDPATAFNGISFSVYGSISGYLNTATAIINENTLTLDPKPSDQNFVAGETITVSIDQNLKSFDNRTLAQPFILQFQVAADVSQPYFYNPATIDLPTTPAALASADINGGGTGNYDLAIALPEAGKGQVLQNLSETDFSMIKELELGLMPTDVLLNDFDLDGTIDWVNVDKESGTIEVIWSPTNATPTSMVLLSDPGAKPTAVASTDFDGNGRMDLAVADSLMGVVYIFLNNASPIFGEPLQITTNDFPIQIEVGDFNNDGLPDFVTGHANGGGVQVHLQNAAGLAFQSSDVSTPANNIGGLCVAYLDNDAYPDIAWTEEGIDQVHFSLNNQEGTFAPPTALATASRPTSVVSADFDGNGSPDLAVANTESKSISIVLNEGDAVFNEAQEIVVGNIPSHLVVSDFNKDNKVDLAVSLKGDQQVKILINEIQPVIAIGQVVLPNGNLEQGSTDNPIYQLQLSATENTGELTSMSFHTLGSYQATDVGTGGFKLWYSDTNDFSTALQAGSGLDASGNGETLIFDGFSLSVAQDSDLFLWLTVDITAGATILNTMQIAGPVETDFALGFAAINIASSPLPEGNSQQITPVLLPEPSAHVTNLSIMRVATDELQIQWDDATGVNLPENYLIIARKSPATFPAIADGAEITANIDWADGLVAVIVPHQGITQTTTFYSLAAGDYEFTIIPYSNYNVFIDYKLDGTIPKVGATLFAQPSTQSTAITVNDKTPITLSLSWTPGNGSRRIVVASTMLPADGLPTDLFQYNAGPLFGTGDLIGSNGFVVYDGTGSEVTVTGLAPANSYFFQVFEYNGSGESAIYFKDSGTDNPKEAKTLSTQPLSQPDSIFFSWRSHAAVNGEIVASAATPDGYLVLRNEGGTALPEDGLSYTKGDDLGGKIVVEVAYSLNFTDTALLPQTEYTYEVYAFNGSGESTNYLTSQPASGSVFTLAAPPTARLDNLQFPFITSSTLGGKFQVATGTADGFIVLYSPIANPSGQILDGATYQMGDTVGDMYVTYVGPDTTFTQGNLSNNTNYQFGILPYNGSGIFRNYHTVSTLTGWATTQNNAPANITLDNSSVEEEMPVGTLVGTLMASDIDPGDTHLFELVGELGSLHNSFFDIVNGNELVTQQAISADLNPICSIRVRVKDSQGDSLDKQFSIDVLPIITDMADSLNLVAIYDSAAGNIGWNLAEPVKTWQGVKVKAGRVRQLNLANKHLDDLHLSAIEGLDSLVFLNVNLNNLTFDFLEPLVNVVDSFTYQFQGAFAQRDTIVTYSGEEVPLEVEVKTPNEAYQWYQYNQAIDGANAAVLVMSDVQQEAFGIYTCAVTSSIATEITLWRKPYFLKVINILSEADSLALYKLYTNLGVRFDPERPAGTWPGVVLEGNKIIEINLSNRNLQGFISPIIAQLDDLERLDLFNNQLTGELPEEIGSLTKLTYLDLDQNELEGDIPAGITSLKMLNTLWLSRNNFSTLQGDWQEFTHLEYLFLQENQLATLPPEILAITTLKVLNLSGNQLEEISGSWGNLGLLEELTLSDNALQTLDPSVLALPMLKVLDLANNQLTALPGDFKDMPQLDVLKTENNYLTFEDLEPLDLAGDFYTLSYIPQKSDFNQYDTLLLVGSSLTLAAEVGGTNNIYQWEKNKLPMDGETGADMALPNLANTDAGLYLCRVTNTAVPGLEITSRQTLLALDCGSGQEVTISTSHSTDVCSGENIYVELTAPVADGRQYRWQKDGRNIALATNASYIAFQPGSYKVLVTDTDGCSAFSNAITLNLHPTPKVSLALTDSTTLQATANIDDGLFTWYRNGEVLDGTESSLSITESGIYQVTCTNANGCTGFSQQQQVIITDIENAALEGDLEIYPNPARSVMNISFSERQKGLVAIQLMDIAGKTVRSVTADSPELLQLDIAALPSGIYLVAIITHRGKVVRRISKQ